jgi:hypothetical protein
MGASQSTLWHPGIYFVLEQIEDSMPIVEPLKFLLLLFKSPCLIDFGKDTNPWPHLF